MARLTGARPYNHLSDRAPSPPARFPLGDAHVCGAFDRARVQRALPPQPGQGPDGPVGGLRSPDPDRVRPGRRALPRRGGQGGRLDRPQGRHAHAARRHPAGRDEHVDDDQRHRRLAARSLHDGGRGERRGPPRPAGDHPERHHQGVPLPRHLRLPARALDAADRGHDHLHRRRGAPLEPDQHLLVSPAGGGRHAGAGDRVRDVHRPGRARPRARAGRRGDLPARVRAHLLLRQRRHPLRRGARQAAGDGPAVGGDRPLSVRGRGGAPAALSLRRAGELARPHRGPAREQHHPHRARGAGGHDGPLGPGPRPAAAGLERGAGAAAAMGPAVVAAHPADPGLRDRSARVPRPVRGLEGDGRPRGRAGGGRPRGDGGGGRAGRRGGGRALHEDPAGGVAPRAGAPHRGR